MNIFIALMFTISITHIFNIFLYKTYFSIAATHFNIIHMLPHIQKPHFDESTNKLPCNPYIQDYHDQYEHSHNVHLNIHHMKDASLYVCNKQIHELTHQSCFSHSFHLQQEEWIVHFCYINVANI